METVATNARIANSGNRQSNKKQMRKLLRLFGYIHQNDLLHWIEVDKTESDRDLMKAAKTIQELHFLPDHGVSQRLATKLHSMNPYEGIVGRLARMDDTIIQYKETDEKGNS